MADEEKVQQTEEAVDDGSDLYDESYLQSALADLGLASEQTSEDEEEDSESQVEQEGDEETEGDEGEESEETAEAAEPEAEPEPVADPDADRRKKVDEVWDKELQRLQQLQSTMERQMQALQKNPTPENVKKVEQTKSRIDELLESEDLDVDPGKGVKTIATEFKETVGKLNSRIDELEKQNQTLSRSQQEAQEFLARKRFADQNPELGDKGYDELQTLIAGDPVVQSAARDSEVSDKAFNLIVAQVQQAKLAELKAKIKPEPKAEPKPKAEKIEQPKNSNPVKNTPGKNRRASEKFDPWSPDAEAAAQDFVRDLLG